MKATTKKTKRQGRAAFRRMMASLDRLVVAARQAEHARSEMLEHLRREEDQANA